MTRFSSLGFLLALSISAMAEVAPADQGYSIVEKLPDAKLGDFHGYSRYDLMHEDAGGSVKVVVPRVVREGRPWIWRARFFGHQPALDLQLLERGWHVVYCDVTNLYGSDEAMARWDRCHAYFVKAGLSSKPVLEGMSRGGLPIFRWASRNPDKVAAVYGDNPVCDFRTWPSGIASGKRSEADWKRLLEVWKLTDEEATKHAQVIDGLEPLAKAKVPVALVLGLKDDVVPAAENGLRLAERYAELGGPVRVWKKPEAGHHPHGLHPPDELRQFLMQAAGF
ncbi:alpha/beta hydrolase family protein [Haloferula rosea]|uniref:Prolyl oligopeptidase family serine peptidase n=1 Tax=Haloferula rosea TaxID=490093 RepID=A0A934VFB0_9BACT|nr:prolyl oligopeptidase family serine peptidase [Haloferula rosea]MBK1826876.1 prolyl oligopeptidase family serine peptidase [Haloferula rosea]